MLVDMPDLRYCLQNIKEIYSFIFWKNLLNKPGAGWFTKDAPGFLSRFHQLLLKIPGAGWYPGFEMLFAKQEKNIFFISWKHLLNKPGAGWFTKGAPGFLSRLHQ